MRTGEHDLGGGNPGGLGDPLAGVGYGGRAEGDEVTRHDGDLGRPGIEDESAGADRLPDTGRPPPEVEPVPAQLNADGWGDVEDETAAVRGMGSLQRGR